MNRARVLATVVLAFGCAASAACKEFVDAMNTPPEPTATKKKREEEKKKPVTSPQDDPNRLVNISIDGAVIGPVDQNGMAWDGPGLKPDEVEVFTKLVVKEFPVGKTPVVGKLVQHFAGELAKSMFAAFEEPDVAGKAAVVTGSTQTAPSDLVKNEDSYTPVWSVAFRNVRINGSSIVISLWDADLTDDDPIADVVIDAQTLRDAEQVAGPFAVDCSVSSGGMVQRVFIRVTTK